MNDAARNSKGIGTWIVKANIIWTFFRYNAMQNFSGRGLIFVILAVVVFLGLVIFNLLTETTAFSAERIYDYLLIPALLLTFYPAAFAIQSDRDSRMIETLFGIPDHRYKVWFVRYLTLFFSVGAILFALALLCRVGLVSFPVGTMVLQLMFPVVFLASLAFFVATLTGGGNSTAVILALTLLVTWALDDTLRESAWFLFHNPFVVTSQIQTILWKKITLSNRLMLSIGSAFLMMFALIRLQKRDKFV